MRDDVMSYGFQVGWRLLASLPFRPSLLGLCSPATRCNTLQHPATPSNTIQHLATPFPQAAVSGITLAAMEDLGFYLANYSAAECISWGYQQGCAFVTSRCGLMRHDSSAVVASASQCVSWRLSHPRTARSRAEALCTPAAHSYDADTNCARAQSGDPFWSSNNDPYLASKCGRGNDPCLGASENGYTPLSGSSGAGTCDAMCFFVSGQSRPGCSAQPSSAVEEGVLGDVCNLCGF